jgi:parvulin-like peptidyl-prolyl isomerase
MLRLGALFGLATALAGTLRAGRFDDRWRPGDLVRVDGVAIREQALGAVLTRTGAEPEAAAVADDRAAVLERLVDEELLVGRATTIGLLQSDRTIRKALVRAVIEGVVRAEEARPVGEDELLAYYDAHPQRFAAGTLLRVRDLVFVAGDDAGAAMARATDAAAALERGLALAEVAGRYADGDATTLPDALLPEAALRRYLGPSLASAALALPAGGVSAPMETPTGVHLLTVVARRDAPPPPLGSVRAAVRADYIRARADEALRSLFARLRARARIVLAAGAPHA